MTYYVSNLNALKLVEDETFFKSVVNFGATRKSWEFQIEIAQNSSDCTKNCRGQSMWCNYTWTAIPTNLSNVVGQN